MTKAPWGESFDLLGECRPKLEKGREGAYERERDPRMTLFKRRAYICAGCTWLG